MQTGKLELLPDAWALVHTGGNDLMRSSVSALSVLLRAAVAAPLPLCGGGTRTLCDPITERVAALAEGLEALGVRNVLLVGMPLTSSVPAVAQMTRAIAGADCGSLGSLVPTACWKQLSGLFNGARCSPLLAFCMSMCI